MDHPSSMKTRTTKLLKHIDIMKEKGKEDTKSDPKTSSTTHSRRSQFVDRFNYAKNMLSPIIMNMVDNLVNQDTNACPYTLTKEQYDDALWASRQIQLLEMEMEADLDAFTADGRGHGYEVAINETVMEQLVALYTSLWEIVAKLEGSEEGHLLRKSLERIQTYMDGNKDDIGQTGRDDCAQDFSMPEILGSTEENSLFKQKAYELHKRLSHSTLESILETDEYDEADYFSQIDLQKDLSGTTNNASLRRSEASVTTDESTLKSNWLDILSSEHSRHYVEDAGRKADADYPEITFYSLNAKESAKSSQKSKSSTTSKVSIRPIPPDGSIFKACGCKSACKMNLTLQQVGDKMIIRRTPKDDGKVNSSAGWRIMNEGCGCGDKALILKMDSKNQQNDLGRYIICVDSNTEVIMENCPNHPQGEGASEHSVKSKTPTTKGSSDSGKGVSTCPSTCKRPGTKGSASSRDGSIPKQCQTSCPRCTKSAHSSKSCLARLCASSSALPKCECFPSADGTGRVRVCSSHDIDPRQVALRKKGIRHPNADIERLLRRIGVDDLRLASKPAKCCRPAYLFERQLRRVPYAASLGSLPLLLKDIDVINESVLIGRRRQSERALQPHRSGSLERTTTFYASITDFDFDYDDFPWKIPVYEVRCSRCDRHPFRYAGDLGQPQPSFVDGSLFDMEMRLETSMFDVPEAAAGVWSPAESTGSLRSATVEGCPFLAQSRSTQSTPHCAPPSRNGDSGYISPEERTSQQRQRAQEDDDDDDTMAYYTNLLSDDFYIDSLLEDDCRRTSSAPPPAAPVYEVWYFFVDKDHAPPPSEAGSTSTSAAVPSVDVSFDSGGSSRRDDDDDDDDDGSESKCTLTSDAGCASDMSGKSRLPRRRRKRKRQLKKVGSDARSACDSAFYSSESSTATTTDCREVLEKYYSPSATSTCTAFTREREQVIVQAADNLTYTVDKGDGDDTASQKRGGAGNIVITSNKMKKNLALPTGGKLVVVVKCSEDNRNVCEYSVKTDSAKLEFSNQVLAHSSEMEDVDKKLRVRVNGTPLDLDLGEMNDADIGTLTVCLKSQGTDDDTLEILFRGPDDDDGADRASVASSSRSRRPYGGGPVCRKKACSSMDIDVRHLRSNVRKYAIRHEQAEVRQQLTRLGAETILRASRPAKCCRKAAVDEPALRQLAYNISLLSLPLTPDDIKIVEQSYAMSVQRCKNSAQLKGTTDDAQKLAYYTNLARDAFGSDVKFPWVVPVYEIRFFQVTRGPDGNTPADDDDGDRVQDPTLLSAHGIPATRESSPVSEENRLLLHSFKRHVMTFFEEDPDRSIGVDATTQIDHGMADVGAQLRSPRTVTVHYEQSEERRGRDDVSSGSSESSQRRRPSESENIPEGTNEDGNSESSGQTDPSMAIDGPSQNVSSSEAAPGNEDQDEPQADDEELESSSPDESKSDSSSSERSSSYDEASNTQSGNLNVIEDVQGKSASSEDNTSMQTEDKTTAPTSSAADSHPAKSVEGESSSASATSQAKNSPPGGHVVLRERDLCLPDTSDEFACDSPDNPEESSSSSYTNDEAVEMKSPAADAYPATSAEGKDTAHGPAKNSPPDGHVVLRERDLCLPDTSDEFASDSPDNPEESSSGSYTQEAETPAFRSVPGDHAASEKANSPPEAEKRAGSETENGTKPAANLAADGHQAPSSESMETEPVRRDRNAKDPGNAGAYRYGQGPEGKMCLAKCQAKCSNGAEGKFANPTNDAAHKKSLQSQTGACRRGPEKPKTVAHSADKSSSTDKQLSHPLNRGAIADRPPRAYRKFSENQGEPSNINNQGAFAQHTISETLLFTPRRTGIQTHVLPIIDTANQTVSNRLHNIGQLLSDDESSQKNSSQLVQNKCKCGCAESLKKLMEMLQEKPIPKQQLPGDPGDRLCPLKPEKDHPRCSDYKKKLRSRSVGRNCTGGNKNQLDRYFAIGKMAMNQGLPPKQFSDAKQSAEKENDVRPCCKCGKTKPKVKICPVCDQIYTDFIVYPAFVYKETSISKKSTQLGTIVPKRQHCAAAQASPETHRAAGSERSKIVSADSSRNVQEYSAALNSLITQSDSGMTYFRQMLRNHMKPPLMSSSLTQAVENYIVKILCQEMMKDCNKPRSTADVEVRTIRSEFCTDSYCAEEIKLSRCDAYSRTVNNVVLDAIKCSELLAARITTGNGNVDGSVTEVLSKRRSAVVGMPSKPRMLKNSKCVSRKQLFALIKSCSLYQHGNNAARPEMISRSTHIYFQTFTRECQCGNWLFKHDDRRGGRNTFADVSARETSALRSHAALNDRPKLHKQKQPSERKTTEHHAIRKRSETFETRQQPVQRNKLHTNAASANVSPEESLVVPQHARNLGQDSRRSHAVRMTLKDSSKFWPDIRDQTDREQKLNMLESKPQRPEKLQAGPQSQERKASDERFSQHPFWEVTANQSLERNDIAAENPRPDSNFCGSDFRNCSVSIEDTLNKPRVDAAVAKSMIAHTETSAPKNPKVMSQQLLRNMSLRRAIRRKLSRESSLHDHTSRKSFSDSLMGSNGTNALMNFINTVPQCKKSRALRSVTTDCQEDEGYHGLEVISDEDFLLELPCDEPYGATSSMVPHDNKYICLMPDADPFFIIMSNRKTNDERESRAECQLGFDQRADGFVETLHYSDSTVCYNSPGVKNRSSKTTKGFGMRNSSNSFTDPIDRDQVMASKVFTNWRNAVDVADFVKSKDKISFDTNDNVGDALRRIVSRASRNTKRSVCLSTGGCRDYAAATEEHADVTDEKAIVVDESSHHATSDARNMANLNDLICTAMRKEIALCTSSRNVTTKTAGTQCKLTGRARPVKKLRLKYVLVRDSDKSRLKNVKIAWALTKITTESNGGRCMEILHISSKEPAYYSTRSDAKGAGSKGL